MDAGESIGLTHGESWATSDATRASMKSNRGRDTSPELAIRRRLHAQGLRYRVSIRPLSNIRRTADIVFTRAHVAVFIDGCFWHGCPAHYQAPVNHRGYWADKRARNHERDLETTALLYEAGWTVLRFWEHDVLRDPDAVATAIGEAVSRATSRLVHPSK
ncbi:very short patch repair endonuclease [Microbacterium terrisoli]|uniref:very short patch repair endonuclease n=1 Tax=Microbacterium terrisoli TaxID=3242192 RepID=UPI002806275A|nr:very short patch repair endonuclease [Microbacterium protaetiae]